MTQGVRERSPFRYGERTAGTSPIRPLGQRGVTALGLAFPTDVFSLSHIALPFPVEDGLYGLAPDLREDFGVRLGALAPRGERGALVVSVDALTRLQSNPFMPYLLDRVREGIAAAGK